jgi:hypothetical protein
LKWASLIAEGRGELAMAEIKAHYLEADPPTRRGYEIVADYQAAVDGQIG